MSKDVKELMHEIDKKVHRLTETFEFVLKYRELFRGVGLEFAQLKEYVPGEDDASRIDWKASMRGDDIYVKEYEEDRNLDVIVLVDVSSSMDFGTQNRMKHEYATVIAGSLIRAGIQVGDNVGFGMFSDEMVKFLKPTNAQSQYHRSINLMADRDLHGGKANLEEALSLVLNTVDENSYLFIISDFIGLEGDWVNELKMVSGKLRGIMGIMVRDLRDEKIPDDSGRFRLKDPHTGNIMVVNLSKIKDEFEEKAKEQSDFVKNAFKRSNSDVIKVFTEDMFTKKVAKTLELRGSF